VITTPAQQTMLSVNGWNPLYPVGRGDTCESWWKRVDGHDTTVTWYGGENWTTQGQISVAMEFANIVKE
jgi:hypothetical protein